MSLTVDSLQELHEDRAREVRLAGGRGPRRPVAEWLGEPGAVGRRWPAVVALAWVVVLAAAALEPAPPDPEAPAPLWASVVFLALFGLLGVAAASLSRRRRAGLLASAGAAGLGLFASAMCPVSDHHTTVGAWWYLQMAGFSGLVGLSVAGLRRSRTAAAPA